MFGAHRASIYGSSAAAELAPLVATTKENVRESHARVHIIKHVQTKKLDEKFIDYHKHLKDVAASPNRVTLACLPPLAATPPASGQKRFKANLADGEGGIDDTRAFGSGGSQTKTAGDTADPTLLPTQGPLGQGGDETSPELTRANAVTAFVVSPLLPEPNQLKVGPHIGTRGARGGRT